MNIGDLIYCGQVSKRIRQIWNVESLWQSVDLSVLGDWRKTKVQTDFIIFLLDKGCKYLNLRDVELTGSLKLDNPSKLKRLNLEECFAKREVFEELLYSCHSLQQLSFQEVKPHQDFDYHDVRKIILQNSKTLQKINLGAFCWLKYTSKLNFFIHCKELTDLRISYSQDTYTIHLEQLDLMIDSFPPSVLRIDLSWCHNLTDYHIENLVRKCNKITEISLSFTNVTNQSVISIVRYLKNSLELLDLTNCDNINLENIIEAVGSLPKLKYLHYEVHTGNGFPCNHSYAPNEKMCQPCKRSKRKKKCPGRIEEMCLPCERVKKVCPGAFIQGDPMFVIADVNNFDYDSD